MAKTPKKASFSLVNLGVTDTDPRGDPYQFLSDSPFNILAHSVIVSATFLKVSGSYLCFYGICDQ